MNAKGKILIIDDNEDVLFALNLLLDPYVEKIKVTTQPTRIEHFMTTFQPDVILLDMNFRRDAISGQEGFDCLEQILKLDPQAIVLFMTAYADTDKAVRAIKAGAIDFIPKPWEKEKLLATLSSAIKLRDSRKDCYIAMTWYLRSVAHGNTDAMNNIGYLYKNGLGVPKDFEEAYFWFKKAADKNNPIAQYNIGNMYCYGEGMEKDFAKGAEWLTKAALQGNAPAQYNLGRMYQWGKGVKKDLQQARFWFQKAIDNGHEKAKEALTKIKSDLSKEDTEDPLLFT
jgi:TPR repeat protein